MNRIFAPTWRDKGRDDQGKTRALPPPPAVGNTFGLPSHEERNAAISMSLVDEEAYMPVETAREKVKDAEDYIKSQHGRFMKDLDKVKQRADEALRESKEHYTKQIEALRGNAQEAIDRIESQKRKLVARTSELERERLDLEAKCEQDLNEVSYRYYRPCFSSSSIF